MMTWIWLSREKYIERLLDAIEQRYPDRYFCRGTASDTGVSEFFLFRFTGKNTVCREYLEIPEERCGIKIDIFVVENTYDNAFFAPFARYAGRGRIIAAFLLSDVFMEK